MFFRWEIFQSNLDFLQNIDQTVERFSWIRVVVWPSCHLWYQKTRVFLKPVIDNFNRTFLQLKNENGPPKKARNGPMNLLLHKGQCVFVWMLSRFKSPNCRSNLDEILCRSCRQRRRRFLVGFEPYTTTPWNPRVQTGVWSVFAASPLPFGESFIKQNL